MLRAGANAGGPGGDNTAWDCNDSGGLSDQRLNVDLFPVRIEPGERVTVTINFMESDGDNLADTEAKGSRSDRGSTHRRHHCHSACCRRHSSGRLGARSSHQCLSSVQVVPNERG